MLAEASKPEVAATGQADEARDRHDIADEITAVRLSVE
jgi:hypothetical protein